MATPWARTASTDHKTIKSQNRGEETRQKTYFTYPGQLTGSAEQGVSRVLMIVSLNLENDLCDKSYSPKSPQSPSNMYYPIKHKKGLSMDGQAVSLQCATLSIMNRSQLSCGISCILGISSTFWSLKSTTSAWNCLQCAPGNFAKSQSHLSSSSTSQYKALWKPLCLPIQNSLLFSSKSGHFHTEQTAI